MAQSYGRKMRLQECLDNIDQFGKNDRRFINHVSDQLEAGDDLDEGVWDRITELWESL